MDRRQTLVRMCETYTELNARWFDSCLPRCRFYLADLTKPHWFAYHGACKDGIDKIVFDSSTKWNDVRIYCTMAHEMIHVLQWQHKSKRIKKEIHGRFFQRQHMRIFGFRYTVGIY